MNDSVTNTEQELINAIEHGEFIPFENQEERKKIWKSHAKATLKKKAISIRVFETDIQKLKALSYEKGMPYQTLISAVIHQFAQKKELQNI